MNEAVEKVDILSMLPGELEEMLAELAQPRFRRDSSFPGCTKSGPAPLRR